MPLFIQMPHFVRGPRHSGSKKHTNQPKTHFPAATLTSRICQRPLIAGFLPSLFGALAGHHNKSTGKTTRKVIAWIADDHGIMTCDTGRRLAEEFALAARAYAETAVALGSLIIKSDSEQVIRAEEETLNRARQALRKAEAAQAAFKAHIDLHKCELHKCE